MARKTTRKNKKPAKTTAERRADICAQVLAALELVEPGDFNLPWRRLGRPTNALTGAAYKGINVLLLTLRAFALGVEGGGWVTYKQAQALGGQVRRGEKSVTGVFYKQIVREKKDAKPGEEKSEVIPVLNTFRLFHTSQCDGLDAERLNLPNIEKTHVVQIERPELEELRDSLDVLTTHRGDRAYYDPNRDAITMPELELFEHTDAMWRTWLHEVAHATGHKSRLARDFGGPGEREKYAFEELVAEFTSVILADHFELFNDNADAAELAHLIEHAAYIKGWSRLLRDDPSALFRAWRLAAQAADWVQEQQSRLATNEEQQAA